MIRSIVGFRTDEKGDWVAELACHHGIHVRHRPPLEVRPWVLDKEGRSRHLGVEVDCARCDRAELPDGLAVVGRAGPWDRGSLPAALLGTHRLPEGRWGLLHVASGTVGFRMNRGQGILAVDLRAGSEQPIPPGAAHHLVPRGPVSLTLAFLARPAPRSR
ncbi:MAG TPA: DUF3565 domain-containing protein [Candidatus Dormibacteraeota bacterium]|nr:DUF3565 domain-containing protein [Candidatus Dormibacteraeota bacterium]